MVYGLLTWLFPRSGGWCNEGALPGNSMPFDEARAASAKRPGHAQGCLRCWNAVYFDCDVKYNAVF